MVPGAPWACWGSLTTTGRGLCWCHSLSACLGSSFHLPGSFSPAWEARPARSGGRGADNLPQPCPARSAPQRLQHSPAPVPAGSGTLRCRRAEQGVERAHPGSQGLGGGRGSPRQHRKEPGLCLSGLCPAPLSPPRPAPPARVTHIPGAAAAALTRPLRGLPDAGAAGDPPAHSLPQAHPARGWKGASPAPGKEGRGVPSPRGLSQPRRGAGPGGSGVPGGAAGWKRPRAHLDSSGRAFTER